MVVFCFAALLGAWCIPISLSLKSSWANSQRPVTSWTLRGKEPYDQRIAWTMEAHVCDQLGHWQFLQILRGLDYRERYHSFALTQSEDWLLPFTILWEKLIIDSILNMPFELIYIRLENAPGFLIYFSFVPTVKHQCFENTLFPSLLSRCPWELHMESAPAAASSFKSLLRLKAVFSLLPSGNAAKYLKLLFFELDFVTIAFSSQGYRHRICQRWQLWH